jgi:putative endonuclease
MQGMEPRKGRKRIASRWSTYLLRCADTTLYCGVTNDLRRRTAAHNAGRGAKYTRGRRPVVVVWRKRCASKSAALKLEYVVKRLTRAGKERLTEGKGISLSLSRK